MDMIRDGYVTQMDTLPIFKYPCIIVGNACEGRSHCHEGICLPGPLFHMQFGTSVLPRQKVPKRKILNAAKVEATNDGSKQKAQEPSK